MENAISLLGIFVEDFESTGRINELLHEGRCNVLGRMGLPNIREGLSVISVVLSAPPAVVETLAGELNALPGVRVVFMNA
ncbi:MAG: TM1266 family iron-only hydrogenase system putative regulator [Oscillospiraceae bacterium]|nr:iron-only hydrogenase system regulator [Acidobacteriota bacterium]